MEKKFYIIKIYERFNSSINFDNNAFRSSEILLLMTSSIASYAISHNVEKKTVPLVKIIILFLFLLLK